MSSNVPTGAPREPSPRPPAVQPASQRDRFVLDSAHVGDIQGAFGTIARRC